MNQDNNSNEIAKLKGTIKDMERILREQNEAPLNYTLGDIKRLIASGHIPKELGEPHIREIEEQNHMSRELRKILDNSDMPQEERMALFFEQYKIPSPEKQYANALRRVELHDLLQKLKNEGLLELCKEHDEPPTPPPLFDTLEPDEFGISRFIADPLSYLYKTLASHKPAYLHKEKLYVSMAEHVTPYGDTIRFEQRYRANSQEEANKQAEECMGRITGPQRKAHEAAWALANEKRSRVINCDLTDLMVIAYPGRTKASFSSTEKSTFYEHFYDTSKASIIYTKKGKKEGFHLPFVTILKTSTHNPASIKISDRYPNSLSFSVLDNPLYAEETLYHVGVGIKHTIFELRPEDLPLAEYISTRKNQSRSAPSIVFRDRDDLMKLAGLEGIKSRSMQNKRLLEKCKRFKTLGIILSYPLRVTFPFTIKTRETARQKKMLTKEKN